MNSNIKNIISDSKLNHVAIAVNDLERAVQTYSLLGLNFSSEREIVKEQNVKVAFAPIDQNAQLELLSPLSESGAIYKFLQKKGEGLHHLCFEVESILKKSDELVANGFQLLYDEPQKGAHHCLVNFIHPKFNHGVLIEISQKNI